MQSVKDEKSAWHWLVPASVLVVALTAHFIIYIFDNFDFDTYYMLMFADKSFFEFRDTIGFWFPLVVHSWISYRIFGYSVTGFLMLSFVTSVITMLVITFQIKRNWNSPVLCALVLFLVSFNDHFKMLTQYNYVYTNSFFISVCLYFFFLYMSAENGLTKQGRFWIAFLIVPMAFFSLFTLLIPIFAGIFSVLVFRWAKSSEEWSLRSLKKPIIDLLPLILFPVIYLTVYSIYPLTYMTPEVRADFKPLFFYSSEYSKDFIGTAKFACFNTKPIIQSLLPTLGVGVFQFFFHSKVGLILIVIFLATSFLKFRALVSDTKIQFTCLYFASSYGVILFGGIAGIYPFGNIRYCNYLIVPFAVILGYYIYSICKWLLDKSDWFKRNKGVIFVVLSVTIVILGSSHNLKKLRENLSRERENLEAIEKMRRTNADLVLFSSYQRPLLGVKLREKFLIGKDMGWGTFWGLGKDGGVPREISDLIKSSNSGVVKKVLVFAPSKNAFHNQYPSWAQLVDSIFIEKESITAPTFWSTLYERR